MAKPAESQVLRKEGYEEFVIPPLEVLLTWDIVTQMEPGDAIEDILALIPAAEATAGPKRKKDKRRSRDVRRMSVEEDMPLKCSKCEEVFEGEKQLLQHTSEAHPFECPECARPYTVLDSMRKHCRVTHGHDTISFCRRCVLVFTDPSEGAEHKKRMHNKAPRGLLKAVEEGSRRSSVEETRTPQELPTTVREGSKEEPSTPRGLPKAADEGCKEEGYKCLYCKEVFEKPNRLIKHSKTRHKKGLTTCRQCMSVFKDRATKLVHQKTCLEKDDNIEEVEEEEEEDQDHPDDQVFDNPEIDNQIPMEEEQQEEEQEQGEEQSHVQDHEQVIEQHKDVEISGDPTTQASKSENDNPNDISIAKEEVEKLKIMAPVVASAKEDDQEKEFVQEESHADHSKGEEEKTGETLSAVQNSEEDKSDMAADSKSAPVSALSVMYPCPLCDKSYDKGQSLQKHTRTKHHMTVVFCFLCAAVFRYVESAFFC